MRNTEFDDPSPDIVPPPEVRSLTELERLVGRNPRPEEAPGLRSRGGDVGSSAGTADGGRSVVRPAQQQVDSLPGELSSGLTTPDSDEPASSPMKKFEKVGRDPVESGRRAKLAADLLEQTAAETPLPGTPLPPPSERAFETPSKKEDADAKFATYLAAAIADDPTRAIAMLTAMGKTPDRDSEAKRQERGMGYMKACMSKEMLGHFQYYRTAQQVYDTVSGWEVDLRRSTVPILRKQLHEISMPSTMAPVAFFEGVKQLLTKLAHAGVRTTEADAVTQMVAAAVHERFAPIRAVYSMLRPDELPYSDLLLRFERAEIMNQGLSENHMNFPPYLRTTKTKTPAYSALHVFTPPSGGRSPGAAGRGNGRGRGRTGAGRGGGGRSDSSVKCPHCKRSGHVADRCWVRYPHLAPGYVAPAPAAPEPPAPAPPCTQAEYMAMSAELVRLRGY